MNKQGKMVIEFDKRIVIVFVSIEGQIFQWFPTLHCTGLLTFTCLLRDDFLFVFFNLQQRDVAKFALNN